MILGLHRLIAGMVYIPSPPANRLHGVIDLMFLIANFHLGIMTKPNFHTNHFFKKVYTQLLSMNFLKPILYVDDNVLVIKTTAAAYIVICPSMCTASV